MAIPRGGRGGAGMNLRKQARGKPCQVRLPGICDGGGETTVLAHYRLAGYCGVGMKPDDLAFGAWACHACHAAIDARDGGKHITRDELRLAHAEAVMRTVFQLRADGVIA